MLHVKTYCIVQDITILLATGVFLRSVITMRGSPPSATLHKYMCRNDLPFKYHKLKFSLDFQLLTDLVSPLCNLNNLINIRIFTKICSGKYKFSVNFYFQRIWKFKSILWLVFDVKVDFYKILFWNGIKMKIVQKSIYMHVPKIALLLKIVHFTAAVL